MTGENWDEHITTAQKEWGEKLEKVVQVLAVPMPQRREWLHALWWDRFGTDRDAIQSLEGRQWGYLVHHGLNCSPELFDAMLKKWRTELVQMLEQA